MMSKNAMEPQAQFCDVIDKLGDTIKAEKSSTASLLASHVARYGHKLEMISGENVPSSGARSQVITSDVECQHASQDSDEDNSSLSSFRNRVWDLLHQTGYTHLATESTVRQISEMLMNNSFGLKEQPSTLSGASPCSQTKGNNINGGCETPSRESPKKDFNVKNNSTKASENCMERNVSSEEIKDISICQSLPENGFYFSGDINDNNELYDDTNTSFLKSNLQLHTRILSQKQSCNCSICGKAFSRLSYLENHIRIHTGEKPYKCPTCGKSFSTKSNLQQHAKIHTREKPCLVCGKTFSTKSRLQKHTLKHTDEKLWECMTCGKTFSTKSNLQMHTKTHTGEKPYECLTCGRTFLWRSSLEKHMRTHTGEKPYECSLCGKTFSLSSNLYKHARTHTGEKPYECSTCGKAFTDGSDLRKHTKTHTGDRPYKCPVCEKAFSQRSHLESHTGTHIGDKTFKGFMC